jgi:hybrid cluster-associated redox disulfide protein
MSISKKTILGDIINTNPEVVPILASAGLHCIGCHVSAYESLEDGCKSHGMSENDIDKLVLNANKRIKEYDSMKEISFTKKAIVELKERMNKSKTSFVKIVAKFGGEFDFEVAKKIQQGEVEVKGEISVLMEPRIERMLRGVEIDYDNKLKDFNAKRVESKNKK